jgi:hypothetical protein
MEMWHGPLARGLENQSEPLVKAFKKEWEMRLGFLRVGLSVLCLAWLIPAFSINATAQKKSRMQDAARHSREASEVFTEIMNIREKSIPKELLDKAEAIAVFPESSVCFWRTWRSGRDQPAHSWWMECSRIL